MPAIHNATIAANDAFQHGGIIFCHEFRIDIAFGIQIRQELQRGFIFFANAAPFQRAIFLDPVLRIRLEGREETAGGIPQIFVDANADGIINTISIVGTIPMLLLFFFFQKYMVKGLVAGAVKG